MNADLYLFAVVSIFTVLGCLTVPLILAAALELWRRIR